MLKILAKISGAKEVEREVSAISKRSSNPTNVFKFIMQDFANYETEVFSSGGAVHGLRMWPKLKPETVRKKGHSLILLHDNHLVNRLTNPSDPNFEFRIINKKTMEIGTSVPYANILKKGIKGRMAKRNPIRIAPIKRKAWGAMFLRFIKDGKTDHQQIRIS